jgi:hypothetical protein
MECREEHCNGGLYVVSILIKNEEARIMLGQYSSFCLNDNYVCRIYIRANMDLTYGCGGRI